MIFIKSIVTCIKKWNKFKGRASRQEYWSYTIFVAMVYMLWRISVGRMIEELHYTSLENVPLI